MEERICDHCGTNIRVRMWNVGKFLAIFICWLCAKDLVVMQQELKEWVE